MQTHFGYKIIFKYVNRFKYIQNQVHGGGGGGHVISCKNIILNDQ